MPHSPPLKAARRPHRARRCRQRRGTRVTRPTTRCQDRSCRLLHMLPPQRAEERHGASPRGTSLPCLRRCGRHPPHDESARSEALQGHRSELGQNPIHRVASPSQITRCDREAHPSRIVQWYIPAEHPCVGVSFPCLRAWRMRVAPHPDVARDEQQTHEASHQDAPTEMPRCSTTQPQTIRLFPSTACALRASALTPKARHGVTF